LKYGIYTDWGLNKETLQDLIMFYSSHEKKPVTLDEYVSRMKEDQKNIYYATGESVDMLSKLPQAGLLRTRDMKFFTLRMK
jgi:molecular chaperone HtpG